MSPRLKQIAMTKAQMRSLFVRGVWRFKSENFISARQGEARRGQAGPGKARRGKARQGKANY